MKETKPARYRVTHNSLYMFHVHGSSEADALYEAQAIAARTMRQSVVAHLAVMPN